MTEFQSFIANAWNDHVEQAEAVAARLEQGLALAHEPGHVAELSRLASHLHGEHLARWSEGLAWQQRIGALPLADATGRATVQRNTAALALASQAADSRAGLDGLDASDATWVTALAAVSLGPHDAARAGQLLRDALARFDAARLPDNAACVRALAVSGNNLAVTLEQKATRSDAERELMILAAQTGRRFWALAGGWMEIERAEYRLAQTWLKAGDAAKARAHAEACMALVKANGNIALERFFGLEVQVLAALALGEAGSAQTALAAMRQAYGELQPDDQAWCRAALNKLAA